MSYMKQLKKKVGYEHDTPRCVTCKHYNLQSNWNDHNRIYWFSHCNEHGFVVSKNGCCDTWAGKTGDVLMEAANAQA